MRMHRIPMVAGLLCLAMAVGGSAPATAQNLFESLLKGATKGNQSQEQDTGGRMGLQSGGGRVAGDGGAAALVEDVKDAPDAGVSFLDYVFPGQTIDLGSKGTLVLSYFDSCMLETIRGGRVTVERGASAVDGGKVSMQKVACQGDQIVVAAASGEGGAEAGAVVDRVTPFSGQDWSEWTVKTDRPTFKWTSTGGAATVSVIDVDRETPQIVWQTSVNGDRVQYPADAPPLEIGLPYQVNVAMTGRATLEAVFSIDPDLEGPDTALSRVVPVSR